MIAVGIIPARYGATRLPGKALRLVGGKPLIRLVYEAASRASLLEEVIVATDDARVAEAVRSFSGRVVTTLPKHESGSDRVAEAASGIRCDIVVNIQGDEPLMRGEAIDAAVSALREDERIAVSTLATPLGGERDTSDPNVVKVVTDLDGNALYFSRLPIPYRRGREGPARPFLKHIGLYAYRKDFLLTFTRWPRSELEKAEELEQLRILEHGEKIRVVLTPHDSIGVDTPEDLEKLRKLLEEGG